MAGLFCPPPPPLKASSADYGAWIISEPRTTEQEGTHPRPRGVQPASVCVCVCVFIEARPPPPLPHLMCVESSRAGLENRGLGDS